MLCRVAHIRIDEQCPLAQLREHDSKVGRKIGASFPPTSSHHCETFLRRITREPAQQQLTAKCAERLDLRAERQPRCDDIRRHTALPGHEIGVVELTREHLLAVSLKNQEMGTLNPYAHVEMALDREGIYDSPHSIVNNPVSADPLHLYDLCPVSDGAAAIVICPLEMAKKMAKTPVLIAGFGQATDTHALQEREDPTDLKAVTLAAKLALEMAKLKPSDIHVAELHDAFTILEIAESEHVGFFKKGEGGKAAAAGKTRLGGQIPINVSGGLKARGHPVGATGVAQLVDLTWQLRHELPKNRQVKNAETGLSVNFGGFGNNVVSFVLRRVQS